MRYVWDKWVTHGWGERFYVYDGICGQNVAAGTYSCCLLKSLVRLPVLTISALSKGGVLASLTSYQDERSFRVVDFVVLLIRRIVSLFGGTMLSNSITINDKDRGAIINAAIALDQARNVKVEDWLKFATQVSELSQALGKLRSARDKGPRSFMYTPALLPLLSAKCDRCQRLVDAIMGCALQRSWPPSASSGPRVLVRHRTLLWMAGPTIVGTPGD